MIGGKEIACESFWRGYTRQTVGELIYAKLVRGDRLNMYIHDYLVKRGMISSAELFRQEANLEHTAVPVDAQQGLLFE